MSSDGPSSDAGAAAPSSSSKKYGNVLSSGYLYKLGSGAGLFGKKNWKKRFFILPRPRKGKYAEMKLYYFVSAGDKTAKGLFDLTPYSTAEIVQQHSVPSPKTDGPLYPFTIFRDKSTDLLRAHTPRSTKRNSDVEEAEGRSLRLLAFSATARDEWMAAVRQGVSLLQSSLDIPKQAADAGAVDEQHTEICDSKVSGEEQGDVLEALVDIQKQRQRRRSSSSTTPAPASTQVDQVEDTPPEPPPPKTTTKAPVDQDVSSAKETPPRRLSYAEDLRRTSASLVDRLSENTARGSTDGFDMSKLSDRLCVQYLRSMKTLSTERKSVETVLHPLLVKQTCILLRVDELDYVHLQQLEQIKAAYLEKASMLKSGRSNVLGFLRPLLETYFQVLANSTPSGEDTGNASLSLFDCHDKEEPTKGSVVVTVLKAVGVRTVTNFKAQDPYVKLQVSGSRKSVRTHYCKGGGTSPTWSINQNNRFIFPVLSRGASLHVEVWHSSMVAKDIFIGDSDLGLRGFIDNPGKMERSWVPLKTTEGEPGGKLLLTVQYDNDDGSIQNPFGVRTSNNTTDESVFGNLFATLPVVQIHEHVWGDYVVCQVRLEDTSALSVPFYTKKEMLEDGKVTVSGWFPAGYDPGQDEIANIGEGTSEMLSRPPSTKLLRLPVRNLHDVVIFEVFQHTIDSSHRQHGTLLGSAKITLMEILEVEATESFNAESQQRKRTMPECFLPLTSASNSRVTVGNISVGVLFAQDLWRIFSPTVVAPPTQPFQISTFRKNVARANAILDRFTMMHRLYKDFVDWRDPCFTGACTCLFVLFCLFWFDRCLFVFPAIGVAVIMHEYHFRLEGNFAALWHKDRFSDKAKLTISVIKGANVTPMNMSYLRPDDKTSDPYVIISLGNTKTDSGSEAEAVPAEMRYLGRTNTEYLTLSPRWGRNERTGGKSRLHVPGPDTTIEAWGNHPTSFTTMLSMSEVLTEQDLVFEMYDENPVSIGKHTYHDFMGEAKVPLQDLIEINGDMCGEQPVKEQWIELSSLHASTKTWSRHLSKAMNAKGTIGRIFVRLQLTLPTLDTESDRDHAFGGLERGMSGGTDTRKTSTESNPSTTPGRSPSTSSAMEHMEEAEASNYNVVAQYRKLRDAAFSIQNRIGSWADYFERLKNLMIWAHPQKTQATLYLVGLAALVCMMIPSRFLVLCWGLTMVTEKFRKEGSMFKRALHMISTLPTDADMALCYKDGAVPGQSGRAVNQGLLDGSGGKMVMFSTKREGFLKTPGRSTLGQVISKVNLRYFVLRGDTCSLQWWLTKHQAQSGVPPRGELFLPANAMVAAVTSGKTGREFDIEVRGYNKTVGLLPMILIARNAADQNGWLEALNDVVNDSKLRTSWRKRKGESSAKEKRKSKLTVKDNSV